MTVLKEYFYDDQLRRYLIQFMAIFAAIKVKVGKTGDLEPRFVTVPIANASKDRVVAWIKGEQTQNKLVRVPMFSAQLVNIALDPNLRKGVGQTRRNTYMPIGGEFPTDFKVVYQRMPVPYMASFQLTIWASNQYQHYQIMEQLLPLFDPQLQIQTSDDTFDWTRLTQVTLTNINFEENVPSGVDRRLIQSTMDFEVPIYIAVPSDVRQNFIDQVYIRLGVVDTIAETEQEIVDELNAEDVAYIKIFDAANVDIEK